MMKKLTALFLALILTFALAACGGGNTPAGNNPSPSQGGDTPSAPPKTDGGEPSEQPPGDDVSDGQAMASLIKWMMDGTFSYDFTMVSEGPEGKTEGSGSMAIDGDNMAMRQEVTVDGQSVKSRIIAKDDKMYMIDDENKTVMEMPADMNLTEGMMTDYGGIKKIGEGTGEINGKNLPYEEYSGEDAGTAVKYFLDGGEVYGIVSEYEGYKTTMIITNPSGSVPSGAFDLPSDYTDIGWFSNPFGMPDGDGFNIGDYLPDDFEMPDLPGGITLP